MPILNYGLLTGAVINAIPYKSGGDHYQIELSGAGICVGERILFGSYSASVDVQKESAALVFGGRIPLDILISHRLPLESIKKAFDLATRPTADSLKIVVNPNG